MFHLHLILIPNSLHPFSKILVSAYLPRRWWIWTCDFSIFATLLFSQTLSLFAPMIISTFVRYLRQVHNYVYNWQNHNYEYNGYADWGCVHFIYYLLCCYYLACSTELLWEYLILFIIILLLSSNLKCLMLKLFVEPLEPAQCLMELQKNYQCFDYYFLPWVVILAMSYNSCIL